MDLREIQDQLRSQKLDGWLFFDHHHHDLLAYRVLGLNASRHVSRRWYYWIPAQGEPAKLVHRIEDFMLDPLPGKAKLYSSWREQHEELAALLNGATRVAMQYSPECMIPYISLVDAGTIELVRRLGKEVVSSAALIQFFEARWDEKQREAHFEAGRLVDGVRREAFEKVAARLRSGEEIKEVEVAEFILSRFAELGMVSQDSPIVGVNANSGNPHYSPTREKSSPIRKGDFLLIDLWAKFDRPEGVFYDVTWTGFCGEQAPSEIQNIFEIVTGARDRALEFVSSAVAANQPICGWEVDDVCRGWIQKNGFGDSFTHRTGHSIGENVHGNGANLDNFETRDERPIIPRTCFSIEPGIYLPKFGVRSEINCYVSEKDAGATGEVQKELIKIV